jgi:Protein of unknown function (DUF3662)/FHA domain
VGVLQSFERRLGGLVEGAFAKAFKGEVHPAEIASALQREADNKKNVVARDRILIPNEYIVELGTRDFQRLQEWAEPLGAELSAMVREHAAEAGYSFVGPVRVGFEQGDGIGTGVFRVRSSAAAGEDPQPQPVAPATATSAAGAPRPAPAGAYPNRPRLIVSLAGDDSAYFLTHPVTVIGRAAECDLRLDDPGVSRRHAELRYADGKVGIIDLGSTNGISVNGRAVERVELQDGDRIDIAASSLIFRRDED